MKGSKGRLRPGKISKGRSRKSLGMVPRASKSYTSKRNIGHQKPGNFMKGNRVRG